METKKLLIIACLLATVANVKVTAGIIPFIRLKMDNYTTWLRNNDLDPSPTQVGPVGFIASDNITNLDCFISNHAVEGLSNGIEVTRVDGFINDDGSGSFLVNFRAVQNVTFYGQYVANGTLLGSKPISGEGGWYVNTSTLGHDLFRLYFRSSPDGYLDIYSTNLVGINIARFPNVPEIYFENLWNNNDAAVGYEESIKESVLQGFKSYLINSQYKPEHQLRELYVLYWKQIFSETTLEEIISTTERPTVIKVGY